MVSGPFPPALPHDAGNPAASPAPPWLAERLRDCGGSVSFRQYMDWALHDPQVGAYGAGRLRIGPRGDFATSPSLGPAFAELLAVQIAAWLEELGPGPLSLVETGPGEGDLAVQLAEALQAQAPDLAARCSLVLVEPNAGMAQRQARRLAGSPLPVRWCSFAELAAEPLLRGVMLAHEVLDALAVERIVWDGDDWRQQQVTLTPAGGLALQMGAPLEGWARAQLKPLGLLAPQAPPRPGGWSSELHPGLEPWLQAAATGLLEGRLLVVDYALEARRYYGPQRRDGTLMAYRGQRASPDPLLEPGAWDLTAHLCLESLERAAAGAGWQPLGCCRQGEALLALGLAEALHALQHGDVSAQNLAARLARREALLRLVDPAGLGEFRWIAFARGGAGGMPRFLREPGA